MTLFILQKMERQFGHLLGLMESQRVGYAIECTAGCQAALSLKGLRTCFNHSSVYIQPSARLPVPHVVGCLGCIVGHERFFPLSGFCLSFFF